MSDSRSIAAAVPLSDVERMGATIAKAGLFGVRTPEQAVALMLVAQAEGFHPAIAARDYHVINGKPSLRSDAMLARFQSAGGRIEYTAYADDRVSATFSHPAGGSVRVDWTLAMAERAGLTRNPTWRSFPRQMLKARVISEGVRAVFPGAVAGFYAPEEIEPDVRIPPRATVAAPEPIEAQVVEEPAVADPVELVLASPDLSSLKDRFKAGTVAARKARDGELETRLRAAKDKRKRELEATPAELVSE